MPSAGWHAGSPSEARDPVVSGAGGVDAAGGSASDGGEAFEPSAGAATAAVLGGPFPGSPPSLDALETYQLGYYVVQGVLGKICVAMKYCVNFGEAGSRPYAISSAPPCGTSNQVTEFGGLGVVQNGTWHNSINDYAWQWGLDDKYDGSQGLSLWPATWNGVLVGLETRVLEDETAAGEAHFVIDWQRTWWKGDDPVELVFIPPGLDGAAPAFPVVGRWQRAYGQRLGLFQNGTFYLDWDGDNAWSADDRAIQFAAPGKYPVAADFVPGGRDEVGLYADGYWYIDANGNYTWDGEDGGDIELFYGEDDSLPVLARDGWIRDCD